MFRNGRFLWGSVRKKSRVLFPADSGRPVRREAVSGPDRDGGNGFPAAGDYFPGESVVVKVAHLSAGTVASNPTR